MTSVYLDNDYEFVWRGKRRNTDSGALEAATGLTLTARLSATDGGATIHEDLSKSLTERTAEPADVGAEYFAIVDGDALRTHLAANYIGAVIYEVMGDGTNVLYSVPRRVVERRRS